MSDDDDDYSAWEAPPPPPGLADAVIERMREPAAVGALDTTPRRTSRRWIAASALATATAAGVIAFAVWPRADEPPAPASGHVVAAKPSHVALGASAVELDANSDLRWSRDGHRIVAAQPRGTAMWRVAAEDTIVIDAGAAVASVEATGASLRVEVQMNLSDTRLVGVTAVTAAAVALVTVIVYEGHVNVTSAGQTVQVTPGNTIEVHPGDPPKAPVTVATAGELDRLNAKHKFLLLEEERASAMGTRIDALRAEIERRDVEIKLLKMKAALGETDDTELETVGTGTLAVNEVNGVMAILIATKFDACGDHTGRLDIHLDVSPTGSVTSVTVEPPVAIAACVRDLVRAATFPASATGGTFKYPINFGSVGTTPDKIDRDAITKAIDAVRPEVVKCDDGSFTGTLKAKVKVHPDGTVTVNSVEPYGSAASKCLESILDQLMFPATKNGGSFSYPFVFKGKPTATATAECAGQKRLAEEASAAGNDAKAMTHYMAAMKCEPKLANRAFLAACKARNEAVATKLYLQLGKPDQGLVKRCLDNGFDPRPPGP